MGNAILGGMCYVWDHMRLMSRYGLRGLFEQRQLSLDVGGSSDLS